MAIDVQTFKTRALTALIFVAVMLVGLLWNFWSFLILFTVIHFGCWIEYLRLVEKIYSTQVDKFIKWFLAICGFTFMIIIGLRHSWYDVTIYIFSFKVSLKILFWILLIVCLLIFIAQNKQMASKAKWAILAGFIYISLTIAFLLNLRDNIFLNNQEFNLLDIGKVYCCTVIFSIWINDTMAYIVGSFIGKTPFSKISPKKTWEGTIGGAILCVVVMATVAYFTHLLSVKDTAIIATLCAIFGTLGDLFESKLKRIATVKDSGSIMPGHGGFLDRFDSLLFAAPAVWVYCFWFIANSS